MSTHAGRKRSLELQDLLRISPQDASEILRQMDEQSENSTATERRKSPRYRFQHVPRLVVCLQDEDDGLESYFAMIPRNISSSGASLLHGQFVHPKTTVVINLNTLEGKLVSLRGRVVHCRHVSGRVHELGVQFDAPLNLDDVLPVEGRES